MWSSDSRGTYSLLPNFMSTVLSVGANLSQSPIYYKISAHVTSKLLIVETSSITEFSTNLPSITDTHPNLSSPVIKKLLIYWILAQFTIHHKFPYHSESLPNLLSITNSQPIFPSPVITKFLIVETASTTLAQSIIYHKFPSQYPISCYHKIDDLLKLILSPLPNLPSIKNF